MYYNYIHQGTFSCLVFLFVVLNICHRTIMSDHVSTYCVKNITAWNVMCKLDCAKPLLNQLLNESDFLIVNEHGLFPCELHKLRNFHRDFKCLPKSSKHNIDARFGDEKGIGGCALFWHKRLHCRIRPMPNVGGDRFCVVQLTTDHKTYAIIGMYLPHQTCKIDDFYVELASLRTMCTEYISKGYGVICIGDTNCHIGLTEFFRSFGTSTKHGKDFQLSMSSCNMNIVDIGPKGSGLNWTYRSLDYVRYSYIDHCVVSNNMLSNVKECHVMFDSVNNTSDHQPLILTLEGINITRKEPNGKQMERSSIAWHKMSDEDIYDKYTVPLDLALSEIATMLDQTNMEDVNDEFLESLIRDTVDKMLAYSTSLISVKYNNSSKDYWSDELGIYNKAKKDCFKTWTQAGKVKDENCSVYCDMRDAKRQFRREQRRHILDMCSKNVRQLEETGDIDQAFFWWLVAQCKSKNNSSPILDNNGNLLINDNDILAEWTDYYTHLFKDTPNSEWDDNFKTFIEHEMLEIERTISNTETEFIPIELDELEKELKLLKKKKAPGFDRLTSEHMIYSGDKAKQVLLWTFNCVIYRKKIPRHFKKGLIVSIPKSGKDSVIKGNNRGITLMPVMYKLFERLLIKREDKFLHSEYVISNIQSAGQKNCSSLHSSLLVQETIGHHLNKGTSVYSAGLDARKAFDTVWITGLLYKLYKAGLNPAIPLIKDSYDGFQCAVLLNGFTGEWFIIERGVHQGAPFSMWLYMIFLNSLVVELQHSGFGASIYDIAVASPCHADDVFLIALYKLALIRLLSICVAYSRRWRYDYNMDKTVILVWGKDSHPSVDIYMGNELLSIKYVCEHVGVSLCTDTQNSKIALDSKINAARGALLAARGMGSHQVPVTPKALSKVYWSVSVPKLTYGLDVLPLSDVEINNIEHAHRQNAKIVQNVSSNVSTPAPLATIGWLSMSAYISMIKIMFIFRTLCCLPTNSVYRQVMVLRLNDCLNGVEFKIPTPISNMFYHAMKYGLLDDIRKCMNDNNCLNIEYWKSHVKKIIWNVEYDRWRFTCSMHDKLVMYRECVVKIEMHPWWSLLRIRPYLNKAVSSVMSVLLGSQPKGMGANFDFTLCRLCCSRSPDTCYHILLYCESLIEIRTKWFRIIREQMPVAMKYDFDNITCERKLTFLLSGLFVNCQTDWPDLYEAIALFVCEMYTHRKELYDNI